MGPDVVLPEMTKLQATPPGERSRDEADGDQVDHAQAQAPDGGYLFTQR